MAQQNAFNTALLRIGFNVDTTEAIIDQGFDTLQVLSEVEESDIDSMIKKIRETRRALGANAPGNVTFPFLAIKRLKAMRHWSMELVRTGRPLNVGLFTGPMIAIAITRLAIENMRSETLDDETPDKPKELMDLNKWEIFWEQWKTYIGRIRGAAKCPLMYIFRDHEQVDNALHGAEYEDHDAKLIATTVLRGPWYELDNHRVYDEFKALVLKGPGWSFIKAFDRTKNGRNAILTLCRQCEGTSAVQSRKASAYAKIASARYSGQKKAFTFDTYVEIHQAAHNTLAELNEAVPETKKVTDFLAGITDTRLANAKDLILGDIQKLQNFEMCQQYLKTLVYNKTTQEKHERQIAGLQQGNANKTNKNKRDNKRKDGKDKNVVVKSYSQEEWAKLTPEQRQKVKDLRAAKRVKLGTNTPRNTSSVQVDDDKSTTNHDEPTSSTSNNDNVRSSPSTHMAATTPIARRNNRYNNSRHG